MPDLHINEWMRLVDDHSKRAGRSLSPEVVRELAEHIADVYESEREAGRSEADARAIALDVLARGSYDAIAVRARAAGASSRLLERTQAGPNRVFTDIGFDLRYAWRSMRRQPVFTFAVLAILAVGIGATTAAFVVTDTVLLRALPYPESARLIVLSHVTPTGEGRAHAAADWRDYASRHESSMALAAYASWPMNVTGGGEPERLRSVIVSGNFFDVIGEAPSLGRVIGGADDAPSAPAVVVLSHGFWRRRFGANSAIVGTQMVVNGRLATIVGVMPEGFAIPNPDIDLWMPMGLAPDVLADRAGEWLSLVGRLRPTVDVRTAQAELDVTAAALAEQYPRTNKDERVRVHPLFDDVVGEVRRPLWLGALAVLFVLLTGAANAANLMIARATFRRDEMAIRSALGAEPRRLARQLMVESALLALIGGGLGVAAAGGFLRAFVALADGRIPRVDAVHLNPAAALAAAIAAIGTTLVFGGSSAWVLVRGGSAATRGDLQRVTRPHRLGGMLLAGQVAFATILMAGAILVARSYAATTRVDPGFDVTDTLTMQTTLPRSQYPGTEAHIRFAERVVTAIGELPGVETAGIVSDLPFVGNALHFRLRSDGAPADGAEQMTVRLADDGFFRTLRIPVVGGRMFTAADRATADPVAVLNRTAAARFGAALGRRIRIADEPSARVVVGIAGNIKHSGLLEDEGAVVYVPYGQKTFAFVNWMGIVVRGPSVTNAAVRSAVARVDPNQPLYAMQSMAEYVDRETAPFRFGSLIVGSLAGAALVLAVTSIYGLTAFVVGRRSRELGVRLALGASRGRIVRLVLGQVFRTFSAGSAIGIAGAAVTNGMLTMALSGAARSSGDPTAILAGGLVLCVAALAAALAPALRAARIDPKTVLQAE